MLRKQHHPLRQLHRLKVCTYQVLDLRRVRRRSLRRPPIADKRLRHPLRPLDRSQWSRCNRRNELVNLADNLDRRAAHAERRGCGNLDWSLSLAASKTSASNHQAHSRTLRASPQNRPRGVPRQHPLAWGSASPIIAGSSCFCTDWRRRSARTTRSASRNLLGKRDFETAVPYRFFAERSGRNQWFESASLQQRVCLTGVPPTLSDKVAAVARLGAPLRRRA